MTTFTARITSEAVVPAPRAQIWAALVDPKLLPQLTPLLRRIDADGDTWRWHMMSISALHVSVMPVFTEAMSFEDQKRIAFHHQPPPGTTERAGTEGWYELRDVEGGTHLAIDLQLCVDLPLPRVAAPAVRAVMTATMQRTGDRFSANLLRHLGV